MDESRLERTQLKILIAAAVAFAVLIASVGTLIILNDDNNGLLTAMEGFEVAEGIAKNWSANATLTQLRTGGFCDSGSFLSWWYVFVALPPVSIEYYNDTYDGEPYNVTFIYYNYIDILVNANGTTSAYQSAAPSSLGGEAPITNWAVDSDDAFDIAASNYEISRFLKHNPALDSFYLHGPVEGWSAVPVWSIEWCYDAGFDDPHWAQIHIDATNGDIIDVEADD